MISLNNIKGEFKMLTFIKKYKLYFIVMTSCLAIFLICALENSSFFSIIFNYLSDSEFRENYTLAESNVKQNVSIFYVIKDIFTDNTWYFDTSIIFGTTLFQLILPLYATIAGINFYQKNKSIYKLQYHRINSPYKKQIWQNIINESTTLALSIFIAYLIFYLIIFIIGNGNFTTGVTRDFLKDILGAQFYNNYPYFYYLCEGFMTFFIMPLVYSIFSCAMAIVFSNRKKIILATNMYYFGFSAIGFALFYIIDEYAFYLNPSSIMVVGSLNDINSILITLISIFPVFISYFLIQRSLKYVEI